MGFSSPGHGTSMHTSRRWAWRGASASRRASRTITLAPKTGAAFQVSIMAIWPMAEALPQTRSHFARVSRPAAEVLGHKRSSPSWL